MRLNNGLIASAAIALCLAAPLAAPAQAPAQAPASASDSAKAGSELVLNIVLPEAGDYSARFLPSPDGKQQAQLPVGFKDRQKTLSYSPEAVGKSARIAVDDLKTGNTAIKPIPANATLELRRSDFDHLHAVEVDVTYNGKPVQNAIVTLTSADKVSRSKTIDPANKGAAIFNDVLSGKAKLTLVYGDKLTENRDVDISIDHPNPVLTIPAAVTNAVPTLDAPAGGGTSSSPQATAPATLPGIQPAPGAPGTPTAPAQGGGFTGLLGNLIGLAVVGGAIYLLYRWAQSGGMASTLKKAGIEVEGPKPGSDAGTPWQPNAPAPPVVSDPSLCAFCGQKKDAAGNCACTLGAGGAGGGVATAPAVATQPRLVATMGVYSGSIFPLNGNGSGVILGRDPGSTIPLSNDSTVSRRHAAIRMENGAYVVSDEGSSNGVYVNGVRINGSQPLRPGDEVQIGNTRFRFEM